MRKIIVTILIFFSLFVRAQNEQLAQNYFDRGEFEKALVSYEDLLKSQPGNMIYFQKTIDCYQQLQQFDKAEKGIQERLDKFKQANLLVELGYNYQLQKNTEKAKKYYDQAIDRIKKNVNEVYGIAYTFERKALTDYALLAYQTAATIDSKLNFNFQIAVLYGQKGEIELMLETFLNESYQNPQNLPIIQNQLNRFMTEDTNENFNDLLKKALLTRAQKTQDLFWKANCSRSRRSFEKTYIREIFISLF